MIHGMETSLRGGISNRRSREREIKEDLIMATLVPRRTFAEAANVDFNMLVFSQTISRLCSADISLSL